MQGYAAAKAYWAFWRNPIHAMTELYRNHGRFVAVERIFAFQKDQLDVLLVDPRYNRIVLSDTDTFHTGGLTVKGREGSVIRRLRNGVASINGEEHAHYRKLMLPPFRRKNVDELLPRIRAIVQAEIETWPIGQTVDLWKLSQALMQRLAIGVLFLGCNEDGDDVYELAALINQYFRLSASLGVRLLPINLRGTSYYRLNKLGEKIEVIAKAILDKKSAPEADQDLISILVGAKDRDGNTPPMDKIIPHLVQLFGGSYETSQTSMFWTLILLTQFPDAYRRIVEAGRATQAANEKDRQGEYLDWVIKESLRLFPPVPFQRRIVSRSTSSLGMALEKGSYVFLPVFLTNRDPAVYSNPNAFLPTRWSSFNPSQFEFQTFSAGPRTCIGAWFATVALKVAIAEVASRFHIEIQPRTRIRVDAYASIAMSPRDAVPAILSHNVGDYRASEIRGNAMKMFERPSGR